MLTINLKMEGLRNLLSEKQDGGLIIMTSEK